MKRVLIFLLLTALVALFGGTLLYLWRKSQRPPIVYGTESPAVADIVKKTVATGSVVPRKEVAVKPQVSGIIESIEVEPGQTVARGALLAKIRVVPNTAALVAAESRVNQARIKALDAEREHERQRMLFSEGITTEREFRQASLARQAYRRA